ncbi:hypothetical protein OS493_017961 [Desmophyllum pertusum]|uniref:Uncharacterized protein n=1 Tax=Desmophyllum pertusum TaxID=174260 RepID=A0A9X0CQV2_9CNID|nr:hypothetical protein OS493_017961 [Desmophyllum pertusum]
MVNFVSRVFLYHVCILHHDHVCCFDRARFSPRLSYGEYLSSARISCSWENLIEYQGIALAFGDQLVSTWGVTSPCFSDQSLSTRLVLDMRADSTRHYAHYECAGTS